MQNRLVPDFRPETTETYTETYTPAGGAEQTATYKIGGAHPIIGGILDKFAWVRTHAAAVWWNALEGITLKSKIEQMDNSIAQVDGKVNFGNAIEGVVFLRTNDGRYAVHLQSNKTGTNALHVIIAKTYVRLDFYEGNPNAVAATATYKPI